MNIKNLDSISTNPRRRKVLDILPQIFDRLDPEKICMQKANLLASAETGRLCVIGFGKASLKMYRGIRKGLNRGIDSGWIIVPQDTDDLTEYPELEILEGTHPRTGRKSEESTKKILRSIGKLTADDTVIVLISGGGSSLFELPVEGVSIDQVSDVSNCLMDSGADIYELNTFRKLFSKVKGGKLNDYLKPANVVSFIVSDVYGDNPEFIASGPLSPSSPSQKDLENLVEKNGTECPEIKDIACNADFTPRDSRDFSNVKQEIILKNSDFIDEICNEFEAWGVDFENLGSKVTGNVQDAADEVIGKLREMWNRKKTGFWFAFGGETTVNVRGKGSGGRNQELALGILQRMRQEDFIFVSLGTDGIDGMSPAMGGIVDSELREKISNDEITRALRENDSFTILNLHRSAIITGRTGNNVSDVAFGYVDFGN